MARSPGNRRPVDLPSTSLYLKDALARSGFHPDWSALQDGDYRFRREGLSVIVRYASDEELADMATPYVYVIDDDLPAICRDESLPAEYRDRIRAFVDGPWKKIVEDALEVVVSSETLRDCYEELGKKTQCLLPYWNTLDRAVPSASRGRKTRIAWLGTRSHTRDLESVSSQLHSFLAENRPTRFTVLSGKHMTDTIKDLPGLRNLKPLPWNDYRQWLEKQKFDIVVHPLLDTPVNRARSISKWTEIVTTGAVPLISRCSPWIDWLGDAAADFLVEPDEWEERLTFLCDHPEERKRLASRAREIAEVENGKAYASQVRYWSRLWNLEGLSLEP